MKRALAISLLIFTALVPARADEFDLAEHGKLKVTVPKTWSVTGRDLNGKGYNLDFTPKDGNSTLCKITVLYVPARGALDKAKTEADFARASAHMAPMSVEKKFVAKEFKLKAGFGFYATFTDPDLVGKPPVKGDWKSSSPGLVDLAPDLRLSITIFSDAPADDFHKQAVEIVESITIEKK